MIGGGIVESVAVLGSGAVALFQSFRFVQEGSLGLKLRFGKVVRTRDGTPKVIKPGFVWMIPFVETLRRRHVRQQEVTLDEQVITLKSGLTFRVAGALYFRVNDIYKALFEIEMLDESIEQLAMGVLRDKIAQRKDHHDLADTEVISREIFKTIKERTDEWGISLIDFRLTTVAPTPESAPIVNLEAAAEMRAEVLKKTATKMEVPPDEIVASGLGAVMIGAPLVASTSVNNSHIERTTIINESDED
ncbi:hypothetical protein KTR10_00720 [Candidatus Kaiserbacteria bacterium]|nr:hypothetical protein [Candidatus Kaiserbacteria bacterium]